MEAFLAKLRNALEDAGLDVTVGHKGTDVIVRMSKADGQLLIDTFDKADDGIMWLAS